MTSCVPASAYWSAAKPARTAAITGSQSVKVLKRSTPAPGPAAGMPAADAADLVRRMAGRYRLPDALRRAYTLARTGPPAAIMTHRQPD